MSGDTIRGGYIMLHRQFQSHDFWRERRAFSRAEAWLDILMAARWQEEPGEVRIGNMLLHCGRGEVLYSMKNWAQRWGWSEAKVKRFLDSLDAKRNPKLKRSMIEVSNEVKTTRIKVCNYDAYQTTRSANDAETNPKRSDSDFQAVTTEEVKKEEPKNSSLCPEPGKPDSKPETVLRFAVKGGGQWELTRAKLEEYADTFAALGVAGVLAELKQARQWLLDNPKRIKTARGMPNFLSGWLRRSCDKENGSRGFPQKNAAQTLADEEATRAAINVRLMDRPEGEESQPERLKRLAEERERRKREAEEQEGKE
jgi:hypothetical protein